MGVPRTGLHAGTRFSVRSGWNGMKYTTLVKIQITTQVVNCHFSYLSLIFSILVF